MIIIDWNISYMNNVINKIAYLKNKVEGQSFIIILQEVNQRDYDVISREFSDRCSIEYSLKYREPGKFDTTSRKLGVVVIVSENIKITHCQVLERSIFPDRTLMVDIVFEGKSMRIFGLHSITGCQHGKAKEIQYYSFAEAVDKYKPDIIGIDANEPEYDHYELSKMRFYDNYNAGKGCKTFFEVINKNNLVDSFVYKYDINNYVDGEYLACSHIIRKTKKVRYDFLFVNKDLIDNYNVVYDYEGAIESGSDHASIILNSVE